MALRRESGFFVGEVVGECLLRGQDPPYRLRDFAFRYYIPQIVSFPLSLPHTHNSPFRNPPAPPPTPPSKTPPHSPLPALPPTTICTSLPPPSRSNSAKCFSTAFVCRVVLSPLWPPGCDARAASRLRAPEGWIASLEGSGPVSGT